eukprot:3286154-Rhodomonas_salina.2
MPNEVLPVIPSLTRSPTAATTTSTSPSARAPSTFPPHFPHSLLRQPCEASAPSPSPLAASPSSFLLLLLSPSLLPSSSSPSNYHSVCTPIRSGRKTSAYSLSAVQCLGHAATHVRCADAP